MNQGRGALLQGDCLDLLPRLVQEPADRFDLVYVDPPFNAGGVRGARTGSGQRSQGTPAYRDSWGGIDAFLQKRAPKWNDS